MNRTKIILAGGGHAHLQVLLQWIKRPLDHAELVLVSPSAYQYYSGMLPGYLAGHYSLSQCRVDASLLAQAGHIQWIVAEVTQLDATQQQLCLSNGQTLDYDYLSLNTGGEMKLDTLQAAGRKLLPVKPLEAFIQRQNEWRQASHISIVGGGAAGVELALALRHRRPEVTLSLFSSPEGFLKGHQPRVQQRARASLERHAIRIYPQQAKVTATGIQLADGQELAVDCLIAATGTAAPPWLLSSGLQLDEHGFVLVDAYHRSLSHPQVFAVGDVCARHDVALARSGVHAVHAGATLAQNLQALLLNWPLKPYHPRRHSLYLLACGEKYAIASWGKFSAEGAWVWRWKNGIDQRFIRRFSVKSSQEDCPQHNFKS